MTMRPTIFLAMVALGAAACTPKKSAPEAAPSASAAAPAASEAPEPAREAQPPPQDLDVAGLEQQLGCAPAKEAGAKGAAAKAAKGRESCRILTEFAEASRWDAKMPSGEGRWIGVAHVVKKGVEQPQFLLFRARTMPTAQVGPSDMAVMIGLGELPEDRNEHAEKLIRALKEGGAGKKTNLARMYLADFKPKEELGAIATQGKSVQLITAEDTFIRRASVKKLILVQVANGLDAERGDGIYAEVWSAFW